MAPAPVVAPPPPPKEDVPQKKPTSEIVLNVGENPTIIVLSSPPHVGVLPSPSFLDLPLFLPALAARNCA